MSQRPDLTDALLNTDGRVATLTCNRDDVRNELSGTKLVDEIERTVDWINSNESISELVLTGAGKAFSAGGNVKHMRNREGSFGGNVHEAQKKHREGIQRILLVMHRLEVPSVAAITGPAIGAGLDLACCATSDLRPAMS